MSAADGVATCVPFLCPPIGPGTPFGSTGLALLDLVRMGCLVGALYIVAMSVTAIMAIRNSRQRAVYLALAVGAIAIIGTELDHLGDYAHYRLVLHAFAIAVGVYGLRRIRGRIQDWDAATGSHSTRRGRR